MPIRPKVYTAVVPFTVDRRTFHPGDEVDGAALQQVLRFGDRFVSTSTPVAKEDTDG